MGPLDRPSVGAAARERVVAPTVLAPLLVLLLTTTVACAPAEMPRSDASNAEKPTGDASVPAAALSEDQPRLASKATARESRAEAGAVAPKRNGTSLVGEPLVTAAEGLQMPTRIASASGVLLMGGVDDTLLALFDIQSGERLSRFGREGAGPGEFRNLGSLDFPEGSPARNRRAWAFDIALGRLTPIDIEDGKRMVLGTPYVAGDLAGQSAVYWLDDSTLVGVGAFVDARYTVFDRSGRRIRVAGEVPYVSSRVPVAAAQQILDPSVAVHRGRGIVAIGARFAGRIDLYSVRDAGHTIAAVPDGFEPVLDIADNGAMAVFRTDAGTRFGYISLAATSSRLYALFSGRTRRQFPGRASFGRRVHVFDWEGRLVDILTLDQDAFQISVPPAGGVLLALALEPMPRVLRYRIPD